VKKAFVAGADIAELPNFSVKAGANLLRRKETTVIV